jgi:DNA-binding transcriptional MocR family regulator
LYDAARSELAGLLEIPPIEAGLQTVAWLSEKICAAAASEAAASRAVEVVPLDAHAYGMIPREGLQLGFAAVNKREIVRGAQQLAIALEQERKWPGRPQLK